ncbi:MAG: hypothetical protein CFH14_01048, partial [Alphaproteobacteria bacterium MarineAlpha5_Bin4]
MKSKIVVTGPKISSCAIVAFVSTLSKIVGWKKLPSLFSVGSPPRVRVAHDCTPD